VFGGGLAGPAPSGPGRLSFLPWGALDPCYEAVVQATEEAVVNALVANEEMTGRDGHRTPALPRDRVAELVGRRRPAG
jgi:L-aminopeptidase/D-esterase-like protein